MSHGEEGLGNVGFLRQKDAWCGGLLHGKKGGHRRLLHGPAAKQTLQVLLHRRRVEIAIDGQHDVPREVVALVKPDQIGAVDVIDVGVFNAPAVGGVAPIQHAGELAFGDTAGVVVPACD